MFAVGDDDAVGGRLYAADALKAAAGRHRVLHYRVERDVLERAVRVFVHGLVDILISSGALVIAVVLCDYLAGSVGSSSFVALASSHDTAPQRPRRSGVTMQTWDGEKLWQSMQV